MGTTHAGALPIVEAKEGSTMGAGIARLIRRHPLVTFFTLAYGLTWLGAIPYVLGALNVAAATGGREGTKRLLLRLLRWRVGAKWYAMALLLPIGVTLGAAWANVLLGAPDPTAGILAALPSALPVFAFLLVFPLSGAFGEELGWRGFALPRLLARRSPLATSLLLGVLVAGWHAPLFVAGTYRDAWLHILMIVTTTVLFVLLY